MALIRRFYLDPAQYDPVDHAVRNLQALLDSKRDHGSYLASVGIADAWADRPDPEHLARIEAQLRADIDRYEPRVEIVAFEPVVEEGLGRVQIRLACRMRDTGAPIRIDLARRHTRVTRVG